MSKLSPIQLDRPDLFCLGGGIESLPLLRKADELGFNVVVLDINPKCPAVAWVNANPRKARFWMLDVYSPNLVVKRSTSNLLYDKHHTFMPAGVICTGTDTPDTQAAFAEHLGLPTIGKEAAVYAKDKWKQGLTLEQAHLPVPNTFILGPFSENVEAEIGDFFSQVNIIKPVASRSSRGVQRFTKDTFLSAYRDALVASPNGSKKAIAQEFLSGDQLSTESVIKSGKVIFTAVALRNYEYLDRYYPYVIENGSDTPFHLSPAHYANLNRLIERSALALGWDNCTIKGDLVFSNGAFFIIELAPRLSGGYFCSHIIPWAYDYDLVREAVYLVTGKESRKNLPGQSAYVSQRFVFPKDEWIGKTLKFMPLPKDESDHYLETHYFKVGDKIKPVTYHGARLAQVIIKSANSPEVARKLAEARVKEIESQIEVSE